VFARAHKSPEMLKINPDGLVPFITVNGKSYNESSATLRFLSQILRTLVDSGYYPRDEFQRHSVNAMLDFCGTTYRPMVMKRNAAFFAQMFEHGGKMNDDIQKQIDAGNDEVYKAN